MTADNSWHKNTYVINQTHVGKLYGLEDRCTWAWFRVKCIKGISGFIPSRHPADIMQLGIKIFAAAIALTTLVSAHEGVVINVDRRGGSEPINDIRKLKGVFQAILHKYESGIRSYKRRTGKDHIWHTPKMSKRADVTSINMKDISDETQWIGEVCLGKPSTCVLAHFDTGSADFIIVKDPYDPAKSNTSVDTKKTFSQGYADGSKAEGGIFIDSFSVGEIHAKNLSIGVSKKNFLQSFEKNKAIAGLSFPSIKSFDDEHLTLMEAFKQQNKLKKNLFQFTLKSGKGSSLNFGDIDSSKFCGELTWVDVNPIWGFYIVGGRINGQKAITAIDSGTTFIMGSRRQLKKLIEKTPGVSYLESDGMGYGVFDCNITPNVTISYGGTDFKLSREHVARGTAGKKCLLSIVGVDSGLPLETWIMGDPFFQTTSIVFDHDHKRLGFAPQK